MLKSYLEYEQQNSFGVITSAPSNVIFDHSGKCAITGALERVNIWNIRKGTLVASLNDQSSKKSPTVTIVRASPDKVHLAVGYSDGSIIIWNLDSHEKETKFNGHKTSVSALNYNSDGTQLVSGSNDTDIIVWDALAERGLFKLRGHKDAITQVLFLEKTNAILSSSKDHLLKVWDVETKHCLQTVVGHPAEVWGLAANKQETRIITTCADNEVRVYKVLEIDQIKERLALSQHLKVKSNDTIDVTQMEQTDPFKRLEYFGNITRVTTGTPSKILFSSDDSLFAFQTSNKTIEIFNVHEDEEVKRKYEKTVKRARKKQKEQPEESISIPQLSPAHEFSSKQVLRAESKILSFDFLPGARGKEVVVSQYNNVIHLYGRKSQTVGIECTISQPGHRSDIRSVAFSSHEEMLMSTSDTDIKVWNLSTMNCIRTMPSGYGLCSFFVPGNKHVVIGTKDGQIQLYDLNRATCIQVESAHTQSVTALALNPARTGFLSASTDKKICFWEFQMVEDGNEKKLQIECKTSMEMPDGVFAAKYSPNGKYFAASLMDYTVRLYFVDSQKFYLSLYGHKLPVMCLDISSDSTLVVTGSADKNVRIWGIDFGDCHRSLFAHDDTVTQVGFVQDTHYFFTSGKDGLIKYWDADKFEHIMSLEGHQSEIWGMCLSNEGNFLASAGHDRSIRLWHQTDTQLFLQEQREMEMEETWEKGLEKEVTGAEKDSQLAVKQTIENIKDAERILEAIELVEEARIDDENYQKELEDARRILGSQQIQKMEKEGKTVVPRPERSALLLDMEPSDYLQWVISRVHPANIESSLLVLPFSHVLHLFRYLEGWVRSNKRLHLCSTMIFFLLRIFHNQIASNRALQEQLNSICYHIRLNLQRQKDVLQYNMAAMDLIKNQIQQEQGKDFFEISSKLAQLEKDKRKSNTSKKWWEDSSEDELGEESITSDSD